MKKIEVMTPAQMAARISKLLAKPIPLRKSREEIRDLAWQLKVMAEDGLAHTCPRDYDDEYTEQALRTESTRVFVVDANGNPDLKLSRLLHAALGMAGEVGEILDNLKKSIVYGRPLDEANLVEESGDTKWYHALFNRTLGKTNREVGERNIRKLEVRYGKGEAFSKDKANNRDLAAERAVFEAATTPSSEDTRVAQCPGCEFDGEAKHSELCPFYYDECDG